MKSRHLLLGLVCLILAGCGMEGKANGEAAAPVVASVPPPDFDRLLSVKEPPRLLVEDREVHVGQEFSDAESLIPRPKGAANFRDLPPGFGAGFKSQGWEADGEGFGIITYNGKVAVAVHTISGVDEARVQAVLRKYRTASVMAPDVSGAAARYWFKEKDGILHMVCAVAVKDEFDLTESVGASKSMEALRMSPVQAENDVRRAAKASGKPPQS